jgi:hypothetical protein
MQLKPLPGKSPRNQNVYCFPVIVLPLIRQEDRNGKACWEFISLKLLKVEITHCRDSSIKDCYHHS